VRADRRPSNPVPSLPRARPLPRLQDLTWNVGRLPRDKAPELSGVLHLPPGVAMPLEAVSAVLHFAVPNTTVSGLAVKDLLLVNEKYKFFKGVKSTLKTGRWQVRT
jgi:AP-3 complex subunit mu